MTSLPSGGAKSCEPGRAGLGKDRIKFKILELPRAMLSSCLVPTSFFGHFCLDVCFVFVFFETECLYVPLAVLELM